MKKNGHYSMRNGNVPGVIPPLRPELIEYFENGQHKKDKKKGSRP